MSSNYFDKYSFEVGTTDPHTGKTKYTFQGSKDYIDSLKQKPMEINNAHTVGDWLVQSKGYSNGVLKTTAEKMIGTRTIKIESIVSNKLPKFKTIELDEYDPYNPTADIVSYVEVNDKEDKASAEFTSINAQAEEPYERKFVKSSVLKVSEFLHDKDFESMLKSIKIGKENA